MTRVVLATVLAAALAAAGPDTGFAQTPGTAARTQPRATAGDTAGPTSLGTVRITRAVTANGQPLPAGTYRVRLTEQMATPDAKGQTESLERWVEFLQGGQVKGREVASIVPQAEIAEVAQDRKVPSGSSRVEMLKGNDYLRVWINRGGNHYLIHLPVPVA